jgi:hypothetical protein
LQEARYDSGKGRFIPSCFTVLRWQQDETNDINLLLQRLGICMRDVLLFDDGLLQPVPRAMPAP